MDSRGCTPLHLAAASGQLLIVRLLVESGGACLISKTRLGLTPLHSAIEKRRAATARYIADSVNPPFVLPGEPADFLPTCPTPSPTLSAYLRTLPPGVRPGVEGSAAVRAALGPRERLPAASTSEDDEKVQQTHRQRLDALERERRAAAELARSAAAVMLTAAAKRTAVVASLIRSQAAAVAAALASAQRAAEEYSRKSASDAIAAGIVRRLRRRAHMLHIVERQRSGAAMGALVRRALARRSLADAQEAAAVLAAAALRIAAGRAAVAAQQRQSHLTAATDLVSAGAHTPVNA